MEPKAVEIKEMVPGRRWFYNYKEATPDNERIIVELCRCENPGGASSLPELWHKHGYISTVLDDWWSVQMYAHDADGNCLRKYDPTVKQEEGTGRRVIDFDWILPATDENREKLLREIERRAFES